MITHADSHLDHGFTKPQLEHILTTLAPRTGFFIETITLPPELGSVPCGLHGPIMGDPPVPPEEVRLEARGIRPYPSRVVDRAPQQTRSVTVIAGPYDGFACVLFTAYGGPHAPQEPADPLCKDLAVSNEFWSKHALSSEASKLGE